MKIGLIALSGKPVHAGHDMLIRKAAAECDGVIVFVSISDRSRPGETSILGSDMERVWKDHIEPTLPSNVEVAYGGSPVRRIYQRLGEANEAGSADSFSVYSDPQDLAQNFPEKSMVKYLSKLWKSGRVSLVPVSRSSTVDVSGTKMREYLAQGDKKSFIDNLPSKVDGAVIWKLLHKEARKDEAVLKTYVRLVLR